MIVIKFCETFKNVNEVKLKNKRYRKKSVRLYIYLLYTLRNELYCNSFIYFKRYKSHRTSNFYLFYNKWGIYINQTLQMLHENEIWNLDLNPFRAKGKLNKKNVIFYIKVLMI